MKKLFVTLLAFSLIACMAFSANAATVTSVEAGSNTASQQITITLTDSTTSGTTTTPTVYSVDVAWSAVALTYTLTGNGENQEILWNPGNHRYELSSEGDTLTGAWDNDSFDVTVTNHSNAAIVASIELPENQNGVIFSADSSEINVARADEGDSLGTPSKAPYGKFTVSVDGIPTGTFTVDTTVAITAAP